MGGNYLFKFRLKFVGGEREERGGESIDRLLVSTWVFNNLNCFFFVEINKNSS